MTTKSQLYFLVFQKKLLPRTALNWAPEGKRKRGRPRETWRRTVEKESSQMEFKTWTEAARTAIDRKRWKETVKSPILQAEWGTKRVFQKTNNSKHWHPADKTFPATQRDGGGVRGGVIIVLSSPYLLGIKIKKKRWSCCICVKVRKSYLLNTWWEIFP